MYKIEQEDIAEAVKKLSALVFVNPTGLERKATEVEIDKMLTLCQKRNNPSYYKLRHASGLDESHTFKGIDVYTDDGKKMRRFNSGLGKDLA
ncbi:MAG: hypothetical protein GQ531_11340 [Sulfurovum sp.]|nr:hypothetical protein [Sulfurovum sp.]